MRNLAIILCLLCAGYYAWDALEDWLAVQDVPTSKSVAAKPSELFPEAMKNIVPVSNLSEYIADKRAYAEREQAQQEQERLQRRQIEEMQAAAMEQKNTQPIYKPEIINADHDPSYCFVMGPVSSQHLPSINRSVESAKLLEVVRVEAVLSPDRYIVFIIPTTTQKGAQALVNQVRRQGYRSALVITEGPLLNAVQLGSFSHESQAQQFYEEAKNRLKMSDLRMTRLIGTPTNRVNLIFSSLSQEQVKALQNLARKHGQGLRECES